jgi:hypothetical protein
MAKRIKKPRDVNAIARAFLDEATGESQPDYGNKNPHAVELGRLGGIKGGPARAAKLSAKKRSEIAKRAAQSRWSARKGM